MTQSKHNTQKKKKPIEHQIPQSLLLSRFSSSFVSFFTYKKSFHITHIIHDQDHLHNKHAKEDIKITQKNKTNQKPSTMDPANNINNNNNNNINKKQNNSKSKT